MLKPRVGEKRTFQPESTRTASPRVLRKTQGFGRPSPPRAMHAVVAPAPTPPRAAAPLRRRATRRAPAASPPARLAVVVRAEAAKDAAKDAVTITRAWHCPPPDAPRETKQAASTLSKLPPHVLDAGGLNPSTQSPQNQTAYLGSLAERFLPVDLGRDGVRVLCVDPPIFAVANFVPASTCDALAKLTKGAKAFGGGVANAKRVQELAAALPAPIADGMPALVQVLSELTDDARDLVLPLTTLPARPRRRGARRSSRTFAARVSLRPLHARFQTRHVSTLHDSA